MYLYRTREFPSKVVVSSWWLRSILHGKGSLNERVHIRADVALKVKTKLRCCAIPYAWVAGSRYHGVRLPKVVHQKGRETMDSLE